MMMRCRPGLLLLSLLICRLAVSAQVKTDPVKVDTTVGDTIVVGATNPDEKTYLDTTYSAESVGQAADSAVAEEKPVLRTIPDSTIRAWQRDPDNAYANDPDYWKVREYKPNWFERWLGRLLGSEAFRWTILILLGALLLYAIVRIAMENNMSFFYRRRKPAATGFAEGEILPEEDLDERIRHYLEARDKRQAIRYLYLKTLYLLGEKQLIRRHADATNYEYLQQLKGTSQEASFRFLTGAYETVWYGDVIPGDSVFQRLHDHFLQTFKTLGA